MKAIRPLSHLEGKVTVPGSKSYTQRALLLAALAEGTSQLQGPLFSEDTAYLATALQLLGARIERQNGDLRVQGTGGRITNPRQPLYLGNNGTAMRLLTTVVCLGQGPFLLTGSARLQERPIQPLLEALKGLGVKALCRKKQGFPPVILEAQGLAGGRVKLKALESSQYISSLLISAPFAREPLTLELQGPTPSRPYVEMTLALMERFGARVTMESPDVIKIENGVPYQGTACQIEGDVSSASYFFLAAALCQGRIRVGPLHPRTLQGDIRFLTILEGLGCEVRWGPDWVEVTGTGLVKGDRIFALGDMPDMVPSLAILAACRTGRTVITNVAHLRIKESNRLAALARELTRTGIEAEETADGLRIEGGRPQGAEIETYDDHRIAMSFAILGLVVPGIKIKDPDCVQKSFPGFWEALEKIA